MATLSPTDPAYLKQSKQPMLYAVTYSMFFFAAFFFLLR